MSYAKTLLPLATAAIFTTGIACQFIQRTDPIPPFTYYTIWSAALATIALAAEAADRPLATPVLIAAGTGTTISGLVFATVIAPNTPTGTWFQPHDDTWVRIANVTLHGIGPLMNLFAVRNALSSNHAAKSLARPWTTAIKICLYPAGYLATMFLLQTAHQTQIPYPFLNPNTSTPTRIALAATVLTAAHIGIGRLLLQRRSILKATHNTR